MKICALAASLLLFLAPGAGAQETEENYVPEKDPLVLKKLSEWQDAKFGLMMTWAPSSQWGIVESWSLCGEDEGWCQRKGQYALDYSQYKRAYEGLKKTFNPVKFDPSGWAKAAREAGMKYVVFTTKHHDGFCMFDTKTTDYRITSSDCPFSSNAKANVTKEIFGEFRKEGLWAGVYYSKPDWNCEYYWWPYFPTPDRHVNYSPAKYPERWQKFRDFTYDQIEELVSDYGPVDILWFDGAWVRPFANMPKEFESWARKDAYDQDIDMGRIVTMARSHRPGLIVVDRWVNGPYENYLTPEQKVPEKPLAVPWESCITMATSWSWVPNDRYKSPREIIHLLVDIVAKGGNLLLNIGPSPHGEWEKDAYESLKGVGEWMKVNQEAIYGTRAVAPYKDGKVCFTKSGHGGSVYAIYLADENEKGLPRSITFGGLSPARGADVRLLGARDPLEWKNSSAGTVIMIPEALRKLPSPANAWTIRISRIELP